MVGEAEARGSEFGIVLAKDGGIVNTGCTVVVEAIVHRYPDGRFDVLTRGMRRFSILAINEEKAWLQGEVEYFDDDDAMPAPPELRRSALEAYGRMAGEEAPEADAPRLSFRLAEAVDDLDYRNQIQRSRSEAERLRQFIEFVEQYIPRREYVAKMKRAAPTNGFGHKPVKL